jgi:ribosomal protein L12E/L44/L45/RPP1/RPP2
MYCTAAQNVAKASTKPDTWYLTSTLPDKYRAKTILSPPKIPTSTDESVYVALYTFIVTLIYLSGGRLPESKLEVYLQRVNADQTTPIDKTEKLKARLIKDGYMRKIKDSSSGEDLVEYMVGPRGKVEVGEEGVGGMVRSVYGGSAEELEQRLERSLNFGRSTPVQVAAAAAAAKTGKKRRRLQRNPDGAEEDEEEDEEDENAELTPDHSDDDN